MSGNGNDNSLAVLSRAGRELAKIDNIYDAKKFEDKLGALRQCLKRADASHEVINECGEIEVRNARLIGEFCKGMNGKQGHRADLTSLHDEGKLKEKTLKDLGINNYWRYEWIAGIGVKLFEEYILERKTPDKYINKSVFFQLGRKDKPHVSRNSGENEWYTPQDFIEDIRDVMGDIDLDPASSIKANEIVGANKIYTIEDDGLAKEWHGRVYMNPPYGNELIGQFIDKLCESFDSGMVKQAIALVNNATETNWFQEIAQRASSISFPSSRIKFLDIEGNPKNTPLQGQALLYLGDNSDKFFDVFLKRGIVVEIRHV